MADQQYTLSLVFLTSTDAAGIQALQQQVQSLETELKRLNSQQQQQTRETERGVNAAKQLNEGMLVLQRSMVAVGSAAVVFKKAFDMADAGAQLQRTEDRFERLAGTIESSGDSLLEKLKEVTGGITSDATLMGSAVDIIGLKLATTEEETLRLVNVVTKLGLDMQQLIMTFANDSEKRLDQLGLAIDDVRGKADEFERQGFDAGKAFDMAVLVALEERLETLGGGVKDNATAVAEFKASIENATNSVKVWMAEGLVPWLNLIQGDYADALQRAVATNLEQASSLGEMAIAAEHVTDATWDYLNTFHGLDTNMGKMTAAQDVLDRYGAAVIKALNVQTVDEFVSAMSELTGLTSIRATQAFEDIYWRLNAFDTAASTAEVSARALANQEAALAEETRQAYEAARLSSIAQYEQSSAFDAAAASAVAYVGISGEVLRLMESYPDVVRAMNQAMAEQREINRQIQAEFNAGITAYLQGAEALDYYTTGFEELGTVTYAYTTIAGSNRAELERLQGVYEQALQDIRDYEAGIKGTTLSEEARAKKLDELRQKAENTQTAMAGLGEAVTVTGEKFNAAEFDSQALRLALMEQAGEAGAGTFVMQQLMEATGAYSDEQIRAALNAAAMQEKIEALAGMVADGTITVEDAIQRLDDFAEALSQPFGIYIETGPLSGAITLLDTLIARYQTAAGLAGAIDAGELGGGGSGWGGSGGVGGTTTDDGDTYDRGDGTGMAAGGWVWGGVAGYDSVPAWLMPGERVISVQEVAGAGGPAAVDAMLGGAGGGDNITINVPDRSTALLVGQMLEQQRRQRRRSGAYPGRK